MKVGASVQLEFCKETKVLDGALSCFSHLRSWHTHQYAVPYQPCCQNPYAYPRIVFERTSKPAVQQLDLIEKVVYKFSDLTKSLEDINHDLAEVADEQRSLKENEEVDYFVHMDELVNKSSCIRVNMEVAKEDPFWEVFEEQVEVSIPVDLFPIDKAISTIKSIVLVDMRVLGLGMNTWACDYFSRLFEAGFSGLCRQVEGQNGGKEWSTESCPQFNQRFYCNCSLLRFSRNHPLLDSHSSGALAGLAGDGWEN
ncbi:hypothetical protein IFM89_036664, partial [Coptis chinensis]